MFIDFQNIFYLPANKVHRDRLHQNTAEEDREACGVCAGGGAGEGGGERALPLPARVRLR